MNPLTAARAEDVWGLLRQAVVPLAAVDAPIEQSIGSVLAHTAHSELDYPPFDRALMDGYAVRTVDLGQPDAVLAAAGLVPAGAAENVALSARQCLRINTGAEIPSAADAVVAIEEVEEMPDGCVRFQRHVTRGENIEPRGSVLRKGAALLPAGAQIGPGALAALASGGVSHVSVFQRPRVAILSTGDELVPPGQSIRAGQIYDSNALMLRELVRPTGAALTTQQRVSDQPDQLRMALRDGLAADLLCVTGGMSKGTHDLVPGLLEELGVAWLVSSLNLKPGKPMRLGRAPRGGWVLGLPGNPVSCSVCFLLFGRPLLEALQGMPISAPRRLRARLQGEMPRNGARPMFQPAQWTAAADGAADVTPQPWRGSGDPFGMATANALIARAERAPAAAAGDIVDFIPLDGPA